MNERVASERPSESRGPRRPIADGGTDRGEPNDDEDGDGIAGEFTDAFFREVVERVGVGLLIYDESGTITYANDALAGLLDATPGTLIGRTLWDLDPTVDRDGFHDHWQSLAVGETDRRESRYPRTDRRVPVEVVTTALDVDGTTVHVATVTDRTDRVEERTEMERQDERLSEIASVLSHDLRNPLNVAMGRAELAAMDTDSEHFEYVERSLEKMEALITDVLSLTREGSRLTDPVPVDLAAAAHDGWRAISDNEAAILDVDDLGTVESTGDRLAVLFEQLLENAVEHGGPDVTITVGRLEDGFFVDDDGPGIPADEREDVFEYGYSTTDYGTGFGLCIVEHVAAAHDWSVAITESDDGGARIEVRDVDFRDR